MQAQREYPRPNSQLRFWKRSRRMICIRPFLTTTRATDRNKFAIDGNWRLRRAGGTRRGARLTTSCSFQEGEERARDQSLMLAESPSRGAKAKFAETWRAWFALQSYRGGRTPSGRWRLANRPDQPSNWHRGAGRLHVRTHALTRNVIRVPAHFLHHRRRDEADGAADGDHASRAMTMADSLTSRIMSPLPAPSMPPRVAEAVGRSPKPEW
jgi:hypothetical protein